MKKLIPRPTALVESSTPKPSLQARKSMSLKNYFENAKYICGFTHN